MALTARMQKKQWNIRPPAPGVEELASTTGISKVLARVLLNRKVSTEKEARVFLAPKLTELIDPEKMPGMEQAVSRIVDAVRKKQRIAIYGDYDVDGITSVAILSQLFDLLGCGCDFYIPHRIDEGYGLNEAAVRTLAEAGTELLITVDCGITAVQTAKLVKELGMEMIITDHHQPGETLPEACAVVHPMLDNYPNPDSAGAMVAFKLAWGVANAFRKGAQNSPAVRQFLINATTLAAMGTVADVVDLCGENRILTSYGLKAVSGTDLEGVKALIHTAGLAGEAIDSYHIGFRLAPMLNAAGRMGHARLAVELLTSDNEMRCYKIAQYLKQQNDQRRKIERDIFKEARAMITAMGLDHPDRRTIVLESENWHSGVIGIVASRIVDKYYRPAILINTGNHIGQGSARSVEGFNIYDGLHACREHMEGFGGHSMAAGLKIDKQNIGAFREAFESYAAENIRTEQIVSKLEIDAECGINEFTGPVMRELALLEPFGPGNPKPMFATRGVSLISNPRRCGAKGEHLQMSITDDNGSVRCIGFRLGHLEKKLLEADCFSVAYNPQINSYNGSSNLQFVIEDIQFE